MEEKKVYSMLDRVDRTIETRTKQLNEAHRLKELLLGLPEEVLAMDAEPSLSYGNRLSLNFNGGDLTYAALFDLGFEFPAKPTFNEYVQSFSRRGTKKVKTLLYGEVEVNAFVSDIAKPPSCEIVASTEMQEVTTYKAICADNGEEL